MGRFAWLAIAGGVVLVVILMIIRAMAPVPQQLPKSELPVVIGIQNSPIAALIIVAKKERFFRKHHVKVELNPFASGKDALDALLEHKVDLAVAPNIPILYHSFDRPNMMVLATVEKSKYHNAVTVRMGRGLYTPKDLAGRRLAVQQNSNSDYYSYRFLKHYDLQMKDVTMVYLPAIKLVWALETGYVDAAVLHEPFITQAQSLLPDQIMEWQLPEEYPLYLNLVTTRSFIHIRRKRVKHILMALQDAAEFVKKNRIKAQQDVISYLGEEQRNMVLTMWPSLCFCVSLSQDLIADMRKQLTWLLADGRVTGKRVPSLDSFIDKSLLKEVAPKVVTLKPLLK